MLVSQALQTEQGNFLHHYSPTQVVVGEAPSEIVIRVEGVVVVDSVSRESDSQAVSFSIKDMEHSVSVNYTGVLPDMFGDGFNVVARGELNSDRQLVADKVTVKPVAGYSTSDPAKTADND